MYNLSRVIVGNIVINPHILREFLKKSHYFMSYDAKTETITFSVNHNSGGQDLFYIRNSSYENAVKLAEGLGLRSDYEGTTHWSKYNPVFNLYYDNTDEAEVLRMEMLKLGLPFRLINSPYNGYNRKGSWAWSTSGHIYAPPSWTLDKVLEQIREKAEKNKELLSTTP